MHYYKKDIADYHKKAGRLSMLQHGAYMLLIDACYDREVFPTLDEAIDWLWASSKEEIEAVEFVLKKFFKLENGTFIQKRIVETLEKYHANSKNNKRIAEERESKKREKKSTKREENSTDGHEALQKPNLTKNYELGTKNYELLTKNKELKPIVVKFSTDHVDFAKGMFSLICKVAEKTKKPNFDKWADVIRLMHENDKLELSDMAKVFRWANKDSFWQTNILSPKKFRDQYSVLEAKMKQGSTPNKPTVTQGNIEAGQRFLNNEQDDQNE